jgi:hypothetical protein
MNGLVRWCQAIFYCLEKNIFESRFCASWSSDEWLNEGYPSGRPATALPLTWTLRCFPGKSGLSRECSKGPHLHIFQPHFCLYAVTVWNNYKIEAITHFCNYHKNWYIEREKIDKFWNCSFLCSTHLRGLSPRVNYTDRATAACRRS